MSKIAAGLAVPPPPPRPTPQPGFLSRLRARLPGLATTATVLGSTGAGIGGAAMLDTRRMVSADRDKAQGAEAAQQASQRQGDQLALLATANDPTRFGEFVQGQPERLRPVLNRLYQNEQVRGHLANAGNAQQFLQNMGRIGEAGAGMSDDVLYNHALTQLGLAPSAPPAAPAPTGGATSTPGAPAPAAAPVNPTTPAPSAPSLPAAPEAPASPPTTGETPAPAPERGGTRSGSAPSPTAVAGAQEGVEAFLKEVQADPNALVNLSHPEAFARYDRQLRTLEQNVMRQQAIDPQTAAYQLDLVGRARQHAAMARASTVAGAIPLPALVQRLNTADASDPLVQEAWTSISANPENRELVNRLSQQFPGPRSQGIMGAVQSLWQGMDGMQRTMTLGGAALGIVGLMAVLNGNVGAGMAAAGGGLVSILMSMGGGSFSRAIERFSGAMQGPQRTPLAVPADSPQPSPGAPSSAPVAGATPPVEQPVAQTPAATPPGSGTPAQAAPAPSASPTATAGGGPRTPQEFKQAIAQALATGNRPQAVQLTVTMFRSTPDGLNNYRQLNNAFNMAVSDAMIASHSRGSLTPQDVAQLRANWPAIRAQMGA